MDREVQFLIIGLVGGAIISLFINYFTHFTANPLAIRYNDWISRQKQARAKRSVESAKKRVTLLERRLKDMERYLNNPTAFIAYIVATFMRRIAFSFILATGVIIACITLIGYIPKIDFDIDFSLRPEVITPLWVVWILLIYSAFFIPISIDTILFIEDIHRFEEFKSKAENQIAELQEVVNQGQPQNEEGN